MSDAPEPGPEGQERPAGPLLEWLGRAGVAALLSGLIESAFVLSLSPIAFTPGLALGVFLISVAAFSPPLVLLALGGFAWERFAKAKLPLPSLSTQLGVTAAVLLVALGSRLMQRRLDAANVEFREPVELTSGLAILFLGFGAALAGALVARLAKRLPAREDAPRISLAVHGVTLLLALFAAAHLGLAPVHETRMIPPLTLLATLFAVLLVRLGTPHVRRRDALAACGVVAAVPLLGLLSPGRDPGVRFLIGARAAVALPVLRVVRSALDLDQDGSIATWLGGADCNEGDAGRGPAVRELPGDGIDQDCRGGDAPKRPEVPPPSEFGTWTECLAKNPRPNVLLLTVDALRADAVSPRLAPALAPFVSQSAWFTRAYASSTHTYGTLPSLFSGLDPSDLALPSLHARRGQLDAPQSLLHTLTGAGYRTIALNTLEPHRETREGFAYSGARSLDPPPAGGPKSAYSSGALTDAALDYLAREAEAPFFLWVHYFDSHAPHVPIPRAAFPEPAGNDYERAVAYQLMHAARLFAGLSRSKLASSTLVVLTADHGEDFGERNRLGHGPDLFESSIHVPLGFFAPGCPAVVVEEPVSTADLAPALVRAAGGAPGRWSLLDAIAGRPRPLPVVSEVWMDTEIRRAVLSGHHKLMLDVRNGGAWLFDLKNDPAEQNDLYAANPAAAERMEQAYQRWLDR